MKNYHNTVLFILASLLLVSCEDKSVRDYYLVRYTPPRVSEDMLGRRKATEPEFDLELRPHYTSDSLAIASETKRLNEWFEQIPESCEKEIQRMDSSESPEIQQLKERVIREVYDDFLRSTYYILAFSHSVEYDKSDFLSKVKKYGLPSSELSDYIKKNHLEVSITRIN